MTDVLDQATTAAYTTVGVGLLVTDAIVGRKVPTPEFAQEHVTKARKEGKKALKKLRARTEPQAIEFEAQFPDEMAERMATGRVKAWDWIGVAAPKAKAGKKKAKKTLKVEKTQKAEKVAKTQKAQKVAMTQTTQKTTPDVAAEQATDLREAVA